MNELAFWISIFAGIVCCFLPFLLFSKEIKAAEEKARARRLADAKMNARLLRFNL
jgi:hypothetical protein